MVPALRAARQMVRAFSSAILWPTVGQDLADRAELDRHLGAAGQARARRAAASTSRYAATVASACSASRVSSPRKSRVTSSPSLGERGGRVDGGLGGLAGDVAADDPGRDRHGADELLDLPAAGEQEQRLTEERHAAQATTRPAATPVSRRPPPQGGRTEGERRRRRTPRRRRGRARRRRCRLVVGERLHRVDGVAERQHVADRLEDVGQLVARARTARTAGSAGSRQPA